MARKFFGVVAAVALASGAMFALVGPASAQTEPTLTIIVHKTINGTPSSDQTYQIEVVCTNPGADPTVSPSTAQSITWDSSTDTFNPSTADRTFSIPTRFENGENPTTTCTVSETADGDATSHSIVCISSTPPATCNSSTGEVTIPYASDESAIAHLTVTNDYSSTTTTTSTTIGPSVTTLAPATTTTTVAPKPAPKPVVAPAHFTG